MEQIKKKKISTKDKLEEETMKKLIKLTEEEEVVSDKKSAFVKFIQYNVDTKTIKRALYNMIEVIEKSIYLLDETEKITNIEAYQIYEDQIKILNDLIDLNCFMRITISKKKQNEE